MKDNDMTYFHNPKGEEQMFNKASLPPGGVKLLDTLKLLLKDKEFNAITTAEIAKVAGVNEALIYKYFGSKRGLLEALLGGYFEDLHRRVREAAAYSGDLPAALTRTAAAFFDFARDHPGFYRLQLALWFAPQDSEGHAVVSGLNQESHQILEDLFARASADHGNMRGRSQAYAATFLGLIHTYIGLALNGHARLNDALLQQAVHQFQHGIYS